MEKYTRSYNVGPNEAKCINTGIPVGRRYAEENSIVVCRLCREKDIKGCVIGKSMGFWRRKKVRSDLCL